MDRHTLEAFVPRQQYFVGFDSDGCVFDSMELKHKECFIPNIIKYYDLQPVSKYAREVAEFVNLYSHWRGVNRFPGLVRVFDMLKVRPEVQARGVKFPNTSTLEEFIKTAPSLGNPALAEAIRRTNSPELKHCMEWSVAVNNDIAAMVKGLPPFPGVVESLRKLQGKADTMVVSATPAEALRREWVEHGIDGFVALIAGQELGKKEEQLGLTAKGKYAPGHILMVGDALGDLKAARAVNALFYPIVPGNEDECWRQFRDEIIDMFLADRYTPAVEARFLETFQKALPEIPPWEVA